MKERHKVTFDYGDSFTKEEVYRDFYQNHVLKIVRNNGYVMFKELKG